VTWVGIACRERWAGRALCFSNFAPVARIRARCDYDGRAGHRANTAIFSLVDAAVLRPLPYDDPDRIVYITMVNPATGRRTNGMIAARLFSTGASGSRRSNTSRSPAAAPLTLLGTGEPEEIRITRVSEGFFEMLRVQPQLGRLFTRHDEEPERGHIAILSHGFWQSRFGGAPDVVGRTLRLGETPYEIVGVLPSRSSYPAGIPDAEPAHSYHSPSPRRRSAARRRSEHGGAARRGGCGTGSRLIRRTRLLSGTAGGGGREQKGVQQRLHPHRAASRRWKEYVATARPWMLTLLARSPWCCSSPARNVANLIARSRRHAHTGVDDSRRARRWALAHRAAIDRRKRGAVVDRRCAGIAVAWWAINLIRAATPGRRSSRGSDRARLRVLAFATVRVDTCHRSAVRPGACTARLALSIS